MNERQKITLFLLVKRAEHNMDRFLVSGDLQMIQFWAKVYGYLVAQL